MLEEPDFLFDNGTVVVRYIEPQGSGQSIGGTSTAVLIRAERSASSSDVLVNDGSSPEGIEIKMQTHPERAQVWHDYYNRSIGSVNDTAGSCTTPPVDGSDTIQIKCDSFGADKLVVSKIRIEVELT
jgi:hypothetical protein